MAKPPPRLYQVMASNEYGRVEQAADKTTRIVWTNPPAHVSPVLYWMNLSPKSMRLAEAERRLAKGPYA